MNQYEKTYSNYRLQMLRLRDEFNELVAQDQFGRSGSVADDVVCTIDETIVTAEQGRNLPSAELCRITEAISDCKEKVSDAGRVVSPIWRKCFITIKAAADILMSITDDSYVRNAYNIASKNI